MNIGLIDFGSNTFHLIIASMTPKEVVILYRERSYVFLAQAGISTIAPEAMTRAIVAVKKFHDKCQEYHVETILAVGTSALRTADNSDILIKKIKKKYGISPEIIDGDREAELVYKGMKLACPEYHHNALLMDIGGGSTEFSLTHNGNVVLRESLNIGLGVLSNKFPLSDPVTAEEIQALNDFFHKTGSTLTTAIQEYRPAYLIGGSGTFDVLANALTGPAFESQNCTKTNPRHFRQYTDPIIKSNLKERSQNPDIPQERVRLIVHAILSIQWIMDLTPFQAIVFSKFALKEGLLQEHYDAWKDSSSEPIS